MDAAKVDQDVVYVAMVVHLCCICLFLMFHLFFSDLCCKCVCFDIAYVSHVCYKCFIWMLHMCCNCFKVF